MEEKKIFKCKNGHYFQGNICPFCGESKEEEYPEREGDCILCGQLCPDGGYACNTPMPIKK